MSTVEPFATGEDLVDVAVADLRRILAGTQNKHHAADDRGRIWDSDVMRNPRRFKRWSAIGAGNYFECHDASHANWAMGEGKPCRVGGRAPRGNIQPCISRRIFPHADHSPDSIFLECLFTVGVAR